MTSIPLFHHHLLLLLESMCIVVCSSSHPKYALIVVSNRDEYFDRPTRGVSYVKPGQIRPMDLARSAHGTWIGASTSGKIAVLVNYREEKGDGKSLISRGQIPISYLDSEGKSPLVWAEETSRAMDGFKDVGGFSLLFGDLNDDHGMYIMSNKSDYIMNMKDDNAMMRFKNTLSLSNSTVHTPWPKVLRAEQLLERVIQADIAGDFSSEEAFFEAALGVLNDCDERLKCGQVDMAAAFDLIPGSIFVPPLPTGAGSLYGTRTQTLIVQKRNSRSCRYIEKDVLSGAEQIIDYVIDAGGDPRLG